MKKECEETRKALPKYLHGHVFRIKRGRIERHLGQCVFCRSEFEALRRTEETLHILRDINASGGVVGRVKDGVFALSKIKTLFYRPLWIAGLALAAAAVIYYLVTPRQLELEIDSIVKTEPTTTPAVSLDMPASAASVTAPAGNPLPAAPAAKPKTTLRRPAAPPSASSAAKHAPKTRDEAAVSASPAPPSVSPAAQHPPKTPDETAAPAEPAQQPSQ